MITKPGRLIYWRMFWWGLVFHEMGCNSEVVVRAPFRIRIASEPEAITICCFRLRGPIVVAIVPWPVQKAYCEAHNIDPNFDIPF